jgi:hypothetical protein
MNLYPMGAMQASATRGGVPLRCLRGLSFCFCFLFIAILRPGNLLLICPLT